MPIPRELILAPAAEAEWRAWLAPWRWLVAEDATPRFLNRFGCWFLERADGRVEMLDVFFGQLEPLAPSVAAFEALAGDASWREVYLLADGVRRLRAAGRIADGTACYALAPPPLAGGPDPWGGEPLEVAAAMVVDVANLQQLYAQHCRAAGGR